MPWYPRSSLYPVMRRPYRQRRLPPSNAVTTDTFQGRPGAVRPTLGMVGGFHSSHTALRLLFFATHTHPYSESLPSWPLLYLPPGAAACVCRVGPAPPLI